MANSPGKSHRKGITLMELADMFPTEEAAVKWFEKAVWGEKRCCGRCGSVNTYRVKSGTPMPYRCRDCKKYFSVRLGSVMESSPLPVRKWVYAIYLDVTNLKGVSSMKLHRDIGVCQKTAWFMQQRIREAFGSSGPVVMSGPVEVDETYIGGLEKNKHASKKLRAGRGPVGKTAVVGAKDRDTNRVAARVIATTDGDTLNGFVNEHADAGATVYTDGSSAYRGRENHEAVAHSVGEYVRGKVHTNGVESFWSMLKRAHKGTLPQAVREAPPAVRQRVLRAAQHPGPRHDPANGTRRADGGEAAHVPGPDRRHRAVSRGGLEWLFKFSLTGR